MKLVDKLDEIIQLNNRKLKELKKIKKYSTKRFGNCEYALEIDQSLYYKLLDQKKIAKQYDSEISELYEEINKNLKNGDKLVNPFK